MQIFLKKSKITPFSVLKITGSKSESNRVLLLQALYSGLKINNLEQMYPPSTPKIVGYNYWGTASS